METIEINEKKIIDEETENQLTFNSSINSSSNQMTSESETQLPSQPLPILEKQKSMKDRYGFILSNDSIEFHRTEEQKRELIEKETERTKKWIKMIKRWDYTLTHRGNKLRERLRKGIPDALRSDVWCKLSRINDMKQLYPNKFHITQPTNLTELTIDEIERDIDRTFPSHDYFESRSHHSNGQDSLRRILQSYAAFDPETGYCQGMGFIAAMFLIYMVEEDAFYALLSLLQVSSILFFLFFLLFLLMF